MALEPKHWEAMLRGFLVAPLVVLTRPARWGSPALVRWTTPAGEKRFRIWGFEITHGGNHRSDDEYRVQVTSGPTSEMDVGGYKDLLLGYVPDDNLIVVYDSQYLNHFRKLSLAGSRPSPSVQVKEADLDRGTTRQFHVFQKATQNFGNVPIAVMKPAFFPAFLYSPDDLVAGRLTPEEALRRMPTATPNLLTYCTDRGFHFPSDVVARYVAALSSKPFVILAGTTGTGKTKLAQIVSEFYSLEEGAAPGAAAAWTAPAGTELAVGAQQPARVSRRRIAFVPVRPDWTDNQALLGFYNPILQRYEATPALVLILRALKAEQAAAAGNTVAPPHFLVLDEMNLARVEHYFSDFLSILETRKRGAGGALEQEKIALHGVDGVSISVADDQGVVEVLPVPSAIPLPTNLYVVGTVNVDETTYGFSPKVLDRGHVIEFHEVNLARLRDANAAGPATVAPVLPAALPPFSLVSEAHYRRASEQVHGWLTRVNDILMPARLHLGYRGVSEVAAFIQRYLELYPASPKPAVEALGMDAALLQKVLPRLHGNRARLGGPLLRLHYFLRTGNVPPATFVEDTELGLIIGTPTAVFPGARARLAEMIDTLTHFGFVSFFK